MRGQSKDTTLRESWLTNMMLSVWRLGRRLFLFGLVRRLSLSGLVALVGASATSPGRRKLPCYYHIISRALRTFLCPF